MQFLYISLKAFSPENPVAGLTRFVAHDDFTLLVVAYHLNDDVQGLVHTAQGDKLDDEVVALLRSDSVVKVAHNTRFTRLCLERYLGVSLDARQWFDTKAHCTVSGLPQGLPEIASALQFKIAPYPEEAALTKFFALPNKKGKRNIAQRYDKDWLLFAESVWGNLCATMRLHAHLLSLYPSPLLEDEQKVYKVDQEINSRGIEVDARFVALALRMYEKHQRVLRMRLEKRIGNSATPTFFRDYLARRTGRVLQSLNKSALKALLGELADEAIKEDIRDYLELQRTACKKYSAIQKSVVNATRIYDHLQYLGTATGRWSSSGVQMQNLPSTSLSPEDLHTARELVLNGDVESIALLFGDVTDTLAQLVRTSFVPSADKLFCVADYSAIEARVLACLAQEEWRLELFRNNGLLYETSAAKMFRVDIETVLADPALRPKGKVAELSLGYGGGVNALIGMGALDKGITREELPIIVSEWRRANPRIVAFWDKCMSMALEAIHAPENTFSLFIYQNRGDEERTKIVNVYLHFCLIKGNLCIVLPSGRSLVYRGAKPDKGGFSYIKDGEEEYVFGGKLVENITQAVARDILACAIVRINPFYDVVLHVHDEIVAEIPKERASDALQRIADSMATPPVWLPDIPLHVEAFATPYYCK